MYSPIRNLKLPLIALAAVASLATAVYGIQPPQDADGHKAAMVFTAPGLNVEPSLEVIEPGSEKAFASSDLQAFFAEHSMEWKVAIDTRSGGAHLIQGKGIALIPGSGNSLKAATQGELKLRDVAGVVEGFMTKNAGLLGTGGLDLALDHQRSMSHGPTQHYWNVVFSQRHQGVAVDGAYAFFRISHGNLIQFGTHKVAEVRIDATPAIGDLEAFKLAADKLGISQKVDRGALKILTFEAGDQGVGELYKGAVGHGYQHRLAWEFKFLGDDSHGYKIWVDAKTGEILEYLDETKYATVQGQIYPTTNTDALVTVGFPSCSVSNGGTKITDANGNYTYSGGTASSTLSGRYINMNDNCGSISLSTGSPGDLDFGGSGGTDCSTPGFGGAGNTHSSRSGFYHLTNINRKAASFLPGNSWLNGTLTANMNINDTCNAFWNGSTVNFYRSGGGCANTGELAAVFLHEWGHGMDSNDGNGSAPENGTGEALADTFAFLETRDACIGDNFLLGSACANCNSDCSGVRDVAAFAQGGISTIARPDTVGSNSGINCDRFSCPYTTPSGFPYRGPMGYEGHCESYIASTANWDLTQSLITEYGTEAGWAAMDAIWYNAITQTESAYRVASGGTCNPSANVDGCASDNWYTVFLAADDDDGNLANGTPNGCRIWDAFDAHGIACGSRPDCSTTCTPTPVANAGSDVTINEGQSTTIGTAVQAGHTYSWSPGGGTSAQISVSPTSTTTYTVTATTSCGSAQDSVTVTVIPAGSGGPQDAVFSGTYQAPACLTVGSSCDTNALVDGRANLGPETNQPNTINDSCADGGTGTYHSDESNDRIVVSTLDSGNFSEGDTVQIDATVWAWNDGSADTLDLFYAADATNPSWVLITSLSPSSGGAQTLSAQYTLPSGSLQAVRAQFRYQSTNAACASGNYNDRDDLVFAVESASGCTSDSQCDNGDFCDGAETCNLGTGVCESGSAPNCNDGISCTVDSCNESTDSCDNAANDSLCDNGLFCDGVETCSTVSGCQDNADPCTGGQTCNESTDTCEGGGSCPTCIDWTTTPTVSYSNQDSSANVTVESADSILLEDNTWRRTTQTFNVTANTVIEFDFQSTSQGEIHGIGFDEDDTLSSDRIFKVHGTQSWGITDFDNYSGSGFVHYTIPVGQYFTGSAMFLVLVNDNDAGSGNNSRFQNVQVYEDTPASCSTNDDFEGGAAGWTTSGTCTTGTFVLGNPTQQTSTVVTQVGGAHSGTNAIFTATNTSAGNADVDGGECAVTSPTYNVTNASDLSIWYFHGQRDAGDDSGDYFVLETSVNGGAYTPFVSIGDVQNVAAWTNATTTVPAGASVQVRVRVADGTSTGDIVEGGIDDLSICPQ